MSTETTTNNVAQFLTQALASSGKTQREIAQELGYENANIITMFKQGLTKVPLAKAGSLAKALDVDPVFFFKLLLREYAPETLSAIEEFFETSFLTKSEQNLLGSYRHATQGLDSAAAVVDASDVIAIVVA